MSSTKKYDTDKKVDTEQSMFDSEWLYQYAYLFGALYILLGLIVLWEGNGPNHIFWHILVSPLLGIVYLLLGYLMKMKESVGALWLLIILVVLRSIWYDIFLPVAIEDDSINWTSIVASVAWSAYALFVLQKSK